MSPQGNTRTITGSALSLCERGRWREAYEALPAITGPEALLVRGCVLFFSRPEAAKDVLAEASRALPDGELKEKALIWLAVCYWSGGEAAEARDVLNSVTPSSDATRFLKALNASIFEPANLAESLASLTGVENLIDLVPDLYKAKFYNQRAWLKRRLKRTDAAIVDYETARYLFEQADAPRYLAASTNNLAALLIDTKRFEDAHKAVDVAIRMLPKSDALYLAQVYDHKAQILLAERRNDEAEHYARQSVSLLTETEHRAVLADSLITHAKALRLTERYVEGLNQLEQAKQIAEYLNSKTLLLSVTKETKQTAQELGQKSHVELVELALDLADDSLRGAARLVGIKVQPLDRFIRLHKIKRHPKVRKSIITKPRI